MASVLNVNGVSTYFLTGGSLLPSWWKSSKRKAAESKDPNLKHRVELIQDFEFPSAAHTIEMTPDGRYIIATGVYAPRVRVYDTAELSLKCERYMDATVIATSILGDDYKKLAFLQDDRNVEVHAAYGKHYRTRIPTFGRCMSFHQPTAELLIGSSGDEIYRLNLEEGRFMAPLAWRNDGLTGTTNVTEGVNGVAVSAVTALIGAACDGGTVAIWDPRSHEKVATLSVNQPGGSCNATSIAWDGAGLHLLVGTGDARALLYDIRKATPLVTKYHQYDKPVKQVAFHRSSQKLAMSCDGKVIKFWNVTDVSFGSS